MTSHVRNAARASPASSEKDYDGGKATANGATRSASRASSLLPGDVPSSSSGGASFIYIGTGLREGGPLGLLLAFLLYGSVVWGVAQGVGEIATWVPIGGSIPMWANRFVGEAWGTMHAWTYLYCQVTTFCTEIVAVCGCFQYFWPEINVSAWIGLTIGFTSSSTFGELVFTEKPNFILRELFLIFKLVLVIGLFLMTFVMMLGGNPNHDRFGFRYWGNPGPLALKVAAFTIGGPDCIAMTAPEVINPRRTIPKAMDRFMWRLFGIYVGCVLAVGVLVPYNDAELAEAQATAPGAGSSPFVVGMLKHGLGTALPKIMNALVITSAGSCGNADIYFSTRALHAMALNRQAPRIFAQTVRGIPAYALTLCLSICLVTFMTVNKGSAVVFNYFTSLYTIGGFAHYCFLCIAWWRWDAACKAHGITRASLPYRGTATKYLMPFAFTTIIIVALTNGYGVFVTGGWNVGTFICDYFAIAGCTAVYAIAVCCGQDWRWRKPEDVDMITGILEVEADEAMHKENYTKPTTFAGKLSEWAW
ncbi:hypothetical protein MNV49_000411 [Pseudohyphozyma bogoriensis]|nr:hypothetical protein MNV49_000411 [Pseudohyphozyma bogoriensis]